MASITSAMTEIRPAHFTRAQQTVIIRDILSKMFGLGNYFKYMEFDGIDLYDPPIWERGFPKVIHLPRNVVLQWDFERTQFKKYLDLTHCKLAIDTLAYLIGIDVFDKIVTTHEIVPVMKGKESTARFTFNCNLTSVKQVNNVFWSVVLENPIPISGVNFSEYSEPPRYSEPWSELVRQRSDPATRVYPSSQVSQEPQDEKIVSAKPPPTGLRALAVFAESKIHQKKEVVTKKEVPTTSVPLHPLKILKGLSAVFCLDEDSICDKGKNFHLLKGKEISRKISQEIIEISRQSMRECIVPTAIAIRTEILDFTSCVLEENALIDLVEYYGDLHVTEVYVCRDLTEYELMALAAQKSIILRRNPHFTNQYALIQVKKT